MKGHHVARVCQNVKLSEAITGDGATIFRHACWMNLEGIVAERIGSRYVSGRTRAWLKKAQPRQAGIAGVTKPEAGRSMFGLPTGPEHETARVHHVDRRRSGTMAASSARAAVRTCAAHSYAFFARRR
jgi:hypothetical protein